MSEKPTYEELEQRIKEFENAESERKRAEEALQKAHDELEQRVEERTVDLKKERDFNKLLIQSSPVFFIAIDPDGKIIMVNDALLDAQKYTNDEVIGKYFLSFIPEREHSELLKRFEKLSSHHEIASGENYLFTKDGREIFTEWHNRLIFDKNGELDFVFGFGFDITDRKAKEEELRKHREHLEELIKERTANLKITNEQLKKEIKDRKKTDDALRESEVRLGESNQLLAGVLEHTHMMAVFLDPRFNFIWVNRAYADTCNQEPSFFQGKNHFDLYPHEENQAIFQRVVDTGESFFVAAKPFEFPDQPKRGVTYWDWSLIPVKDGTGKVTGLVFTLAEVTERIQAEEAITKSEAFLNATGQIAKVGGWEIDGETQKVFWTKEIYNITEVPTDYDPSSLEKEAIVFFSSEDQLILEKAIQRAFEHSEPYNMELLITTAKGNKKWVQAICEPVIVDGKVVKLGGTFQDITERRKAVEALRENEERFRSVFEDSGIGMVLVDRNGRYQKVNQAMSRILGYTQQELLSMGVQDTSLPGEPDQDSDIVRQIWNGEINHFNLEKRYIHKDGNVVWGDIALSSICDAEGKVLYIVGQIQDITERKQAEEKIRRSKILLESSIESPKNMIILSLDREYRYLYFNKTHAESMSQVFGTQPKIGDCIFDRMKGKDDIAKVKEHYDRVFAGEGHVAIEEYGEGQMRYYYEIRYNPVYDEKNEIIGVTSFAQNITDRKQAEEALWERTEELDERVKELNCLYGISNLVEKPDISLEEIFQGVVDLIPSSWRYPEITCSRMLLEDKEYKTENFKETGWKQSSDIFVYGKRMGFLEIYYLEERPEIDEGPFLKEERDLINAIAERLGRIIERMQARADKERLEAQLRETKKMEVIATLAGGIAHQFNNALTSVVGNIQLLEMDFADNKTVTGYTEPMKASSHWMANLTSQLLAYARGGKYQVKTMSLSDFVEANLSIIKSNIDPAIRLETDLPRDVFSVKADPTQMQMVLSAVVSNSTEAMEGESSIRIITSNEEIDAEFAKNHPKLTPGNYVCLTVEDDGKGMDEETLNKIFDPFYTTKFIGRGLGMAAVYGIIRSHDGWITVDSELNKWTIIRIYLPAIEAEEIEKKPIVDSATEMSKGKGTILIIEDEEMVMNVILAVLERLGYRMLEAKTGREAVEIAKTFDGDIDLALLDIKLPDIRGDKVYPLIMEARPDLKVIVCSGYSIDTARDILDAGAQDFIQKPFSVKELSQKLSKLLKEE